VENQLKSRADWQGDHVDIIEHYSKQQNSRQSCSAFTPHCEWRTAQVILD